MVITPEDIDDADADAADVALRFSVDARHAGARLDKALAELMPDVSRSRLQQWVADAAVRVNGAQVRQRHELVLGDLIEVEPQPAPDAAAFTPEPMALAIVHEDDAIIVLDKPPGLVVHPAAGHWSGTLLNGLLAHAPQLTGVPRAGIVHRLDADTSGLMVVAKTLSAQTHLVRQLQERSVTREYWAVVLGVPPPGGTVDAPIGRDPRNPLRFRVSHAASAKPARTRFAVIDTARDGGAALSWLACRLETGRTHQIRVHMEHVGHPLVGDPVYRRGLPGREGEVHTWRGFTRQALHASRLGLIHPTTGQAMAWFRPPPADLAELMRGLGFGPLDEPARAFEAAA
ncbi:MAG TPA: RluA family pseudouridine synthase [Burkholderiaceae bacterium]|nr:RluA family pseudouridine synthase [Burkholderiaceae bacterium]